MILALRALGLGDLLTAVPALRGLRAALPGPLVLATPAWLAPLAAPLADRLLPTAGLDAPLDTDRPEVAVNLHGSGPESHRLLAATRPGALWAFGNDRAGHAGPAWPAGDHEVRRWCRLLSWYGVSADPADLRLPPPEAHPAVAGATIVHPGAKSPARRWPPRRFAAVARRLAADGHHVVVTGSAAERDLARAVAEAAGLPADRVLAGGTGIGELAALVAAARLVVSGDTGIAHLATAYGTPSVVLFGPVPPRLWGPPPSPVHHAIWHGTRVDRGDTTAPGVHPALLRVTVPEVLAAAERVQQALSSPTG
ncbi:glycosyltransferase family 9 protein [Spirilliplanes yamanashiensis]|uniref:ADP-heptose:LPS heptosyltransferase n=1 Tax=Spirilliplanes yamanashiensis TaxID=42233 RepID=A0A8J3YAS9_9ACTN|nr:glycosyltransferase family 9 protein [Spirilliplanes yamanashiensis]MDP9817550.1 ADP-heptose:LPS heptosyltransferase [Spirilliplanes yamanashiensis]GIJ04360.1 hypothetical protein Sya03_37120 [Spirilliplanes yamanashiensis]